jgi:hypothetical protein
MSRPMHFFGGVGFALFFLGVISGTLAIFLRLFFGLHLVQTPLPIATVFFILMGVNLIMMGIVVEMQVRTYYELQGGKSYRIKETLHL